MVKPYRDKEVVGVFVHFFFVRLQLVYVMLNGALWIGYWLLGLSCHHGLSVTAQVVVLRRAC
jgi:hypothetical protein